MDPDLEYALVNAGRIGELSTEIRALAIALVVVVLIGVSAWRRLARGMRQNLSSLDALTKRHDDIERRINNTIRELQAITGDLHASSLAWTEAQRKAEAHLERTLIAYEGRVRSTVQQLDHQMTAVIAGVTAAGKGRVPRG